MAGKNGQNRQDGQELIKVVAKSYWRKYESICIISAMCVGIPGQVVALKGKKAKVRQQGHCHWLDTSLIADGVKKGDWLLSYQDAAINKVSAVSAREVINLLGDTHDHC